MIAGRSKKSSGESEQVGQPVPVPAGWTASSSLSAKASTHRQQRLIDTQFK